MPSVDFFDDRDDADLLACARNGDARCADILWVRVRPAVLAVARGIAENAHDAEDLASEAMAKVFAAIADGHGPTEAILPYLYATMRNLHISTLRRQARVGNPLALDEHRVLNLVTVEPDVIESELVTRAFKNLPDRWRYVLWAGLVEGRPGGEIADELAIKPAAVHALKARALEGLRQQYLSEHAKLSEEQECAAVHRVLASIARGRARRSTDLGQVWRHLRGCEHCAEGYREITAINHRIGALLGPAAATLVGFVPHSGGGAAWGILRLPAEAGKYVAAASVAGAIAVAGSTLTLGNQSVAAATNPPAVAAHAVAEQTPGVVPPRKPVRRAATESEAPSPASAPAACAPTDLGTDELAPALRIAPLVTSTELTCATHTVPTLRHLDPAAALVSLKPLESAAPLVPDTGSVPVPAPERVVPDLSVPQTSVLQR